MPSLFDDDVVARRVLEELRWPEGPRCTHCDASGPDVFLIRGEKRNHRNGLYHCKRCRKQFTVTLGTVFERSRVPLSTWMRAAYVANRASQQQPDWELEIGITYKTVVRMKEIIQHAAKRYRGHKDTRDFGPFPRSFMRKTPKSHGNRRTKEALLASGKHPSQHTIRATGVLRGLAPAQGVTEADLRRAECLLRLLLLAEKKAVQSSARQRRRL